MKLEIGSEFHQMPFETGKGFMYPQAQDSVLCFSGRVALATILKNLTGIRKAMLPSYCCESMVEPFLRAGIETVFYQVNYKEGLQVQMDIPSDVDVLLWCNYFGFSVPMPDVTDFINRGGIIIEDITHSLFSKQVCHSCSHYLVASLRKWEPIYCGGYGASMQTNLKHKPMQTPDKRFLTLKSKAMELKTQYLVDLKEDKKNQFLQLFKESSQWFNITDSMSFGIDAYSQKFLACVDMARQHEIRRRNAKVLYHGLKNRIHFLFPQEDMDCPLFVPIFCPTDLEKIVTQLKANKIYCPSHWPHPSVNCASNLYNHELSLVCDQRYTVEDMERIVDVIVKEIK